MCGNIVCTVASRCTRRYVHELEEQLSAEYLPSDDRCHGRLRAGSQSGIWAIA
jgi:hypothetical protein